MRLSGNELSSTPAEALAPLLELCGLAPGAASTAAASYSKGRQEAYTDAERRKHLREQEPQWGDDADKAIAWAATLGPRDLLVFGVGARRGNSDP